MIDVAKVINGRRERPISSSSIAKTRPALCQGAEVGGGQRARSRRRRRKPSKRAPTPEGDRADRIENGKLIFSRFVCARSRSHGCLLLGVVAEVPPTSVPQISGQQ